MSERIDINTSRHAVQSAAQSTRRTSQNVKTGGYSSFPESKELTPEFYDLVYSVDSAAANDNYYVTSGDFLELHSQLRKELLSGIFWWSCGLCLLLISAVFLNA